MADKETHVQQLIRALRTEGRSSTDMRDAIELLIKITRNVLPPKDGTKVNGKFLQINPANPDFNRKIWKSQAARRILFISGWERRGEGETLRLVRSVDDFGDTKAETQVSSEDLMKILIENRNISPLEDEWVNETKHERVMTSDEKYRLDKLRGEVERKAAYAKAMKEKQERKELAENLKKEQLADRAYRNIRRPLTDNELRAITPNWEPMRTRRRQSPPEESPRQSPPDDDEEGDIQAPGPP